MEKWQVYLPDGWPGLRAPAEPRVSFTNDGDPYPGAWLWVRLPDGADDLWSSSSIPIWRGPDARRVPRVEQLCRAFRESLVFCQELEAARDEFYDEWMPWAPLAEIGEVLV